MDHTVRCNRRGILNCALALMLENSMFQGALDQLGGDLAADDRKVTVTGALIHGRPSPIIKEARCRPTLCCDDPTVGRGSNSLYWSECPVEPLSSGSPSLKERVLKLMGPNFSIQREAGGEDSVSSCRTPSPWLLPALTQVCWAAVRPQGHSQLQRG